MLGFKIFDDNKIEDLDVILKYVHENELSLEIALYHTIENSIKFKNYLLENKHFKLIEKKAIHLDYKKYIGGELNNEESIRLFNLELQFAKELNIKNAILHYQTPSTFRNHLEQMKTENLQTNLKLIKDIASKYDVYIHIENTYIYKSKNECNDLVNHRKIWDTIIDLKLEKYIGICLDWGHVKAFTNDSLVIWMDYVKELKEKGILIHMHVHDNDGKKDLHDSLSMGKEKGFDGLNNQMAFIDILKNNINYFKEDSLILEYDAEWSITEYEKLIKYL